MVGLTTSLGFKQIYSQRKKTAIVYYLPKWLVVKNLILATEHFEVRPAALLRKSSHGRGAQHRLPERPPSFSCPDLLLRLGSV